MNLPQAEDLLHFGSRILKSQGCHNHSGTESLIIPGWDFEIPRLGSFIFRLRATFHFEFSWFSPAHLTFVDIEH